VNVDVPSSIVELSPCGARTRFEWLLSALGETEMNQPGTKFSHRDLGKVGSVYRAEVKPGFHPGFENITIDGLGRFVFQ
jgi:hypothetical protein